VTPLIVNDVAKVIMITTVFPLPAVLSYLPMRVIVGKVSVAIGRGCFFSSGMLCLIV
jgi:hypothetical protein